MRPFSKFVIIAVFTLSTFGIGENVFAKGSSAAAEIELGVPLPVLPRVNVYYYCNFSRYEYSGQNFAGGHYTSQWSNYGNLEAQIGGPMSHQLFVSISGPTGSDPINLSVILEASEEGIQVRNIYFWLSHNTSNGLGAFSISGQSNSGYARYNEGVHVQATHNQVSYDLPYAGISDIIWCYVYISKIGN